MRSPPLAALRGPDLIADARGRPAVPAMAQRGVVQPHVHTTPGQTPGDTGKETLVVESACRPAAPQPDLLEPEGPGAYGAREVTRRPASSEVAA